MIVMAAFSPSQISRAVLECLKFGIQVDKVGVDVLSLDGDPVKSSEVVANCNGRIVGLDA